MPGRISRFAISVNSRQCVDGDNREFRLGTYIIQKGAQRQWARYPCALHFTEKATKSLSYRVIKLTAVIANNL